jgi:hypothetical protein
MKRSDHWVWLRNTFSLAAIVVLIGFAAAPRFAAACTGDCGNVGKVTVTDILTMVDIALGTEQLSACANGDVSGDHLITVDEILQAVNNALAGCGPPPGCGNGVVEANLGEECDDGGTCIGGPNAGTHCTAESDCQGFGVCIGGDKPETNCDPTNPNACPSGSCKKCVPQGGDGCAANCTTETSVVMTLKPGQKNGPTRLIPGTSGSTVWNAVLGPLALTMVGNQTLVVGRERNNQIPVAVNAVHLDQINVADLSCACTRGVPARTCGGVLIDADGTTIATDCTPGYTMGTCSESTPVTCTTDNEIDVCPSQSCVGGICGDCRTDNDCSGTCVMHACDHKNPCTYVHGLGGTCSVTTTQTCGPKAPCPNGETCVQGGVLSSGAISCVSGLAGTNMLMTDDSRRADGQEDPPKCDYTNPDTFVSGSTFPDCASYPKITMTDENPAPVGAAQVLNSTAIGTYTGTCASDDPNRPSDFCTDQEDFSTRGTVVTLPAVTGSACAEMTDIFYGGQTIDGLAVCDCADKTCSNNKSLACLTDNDCGGPPNTCKMSFSCPVLTPCAAGQRCCTGPLCVTGSKLPSCSQLTGSSPSVSGLGLAGAFTAPAQATISDIVVTDLLQAQ